MVRTYWLVPVFYEASGNLDLQPFARTDHVEACRPRAMSARLYGVDMFAERNGATDCLPGPAGDAEAG
jgi:hypothetical protein